MKNQKHSRKARRVIVMLLAVAIVSFIALSRFPSTNLAQNQNDDPQAKETNVDKTLSPYFFVQGDPSVDQLPLKDTHVDIAVSGVIADVKVDFTLHDPDDLLVRMGMWARFMARLQPMKCHGRPLAAEGLAVDPGLDQARRNGGAE